MRGARPSSARRLAVDVLDRVLGDAKRPMDETFLGHPGLPGLGPRDRAFARLLIVTVLRRLGQIDAVLAPLLRFRPRQIRIRNLLRLGVAQLLFLGTRPHAAVAETVALTAQRFQREAGMINAVLRRIAAGGPALLDGQDAPRLNTPDWLWESWVTAYGEDTTRAIAEAHMREPPLDLSVRADPVVWAERLDATVLSNGTVRCRQRGAIEAMPGFAEGAWWVQDAAAALPVAALGGVSGREVIEIGAAPGGKTAQLVIAGARVTALELGESRALRMRGNLERLGLEADVVVADAREWRPDRPADAVLLDAPCTATGTIRRHPDVLWHKTPDDVARMAELQAALLDAAAAMLAPGGVLVYASCSLQPEEGPAQTDRLLARGDLTLEPVAPPLAVTTTARGEVRSLPSDLAEAGGVDGFYIARLRRS